MSISSLNRKIITLGTKLIATIKYEIDSKYSAFDFFRAEFDKKKALEAKLKKYLTSQ